MKANKLTSDQFLQNISLLKNKFRMHNTDYGSTPLQVLYLIEKCKGIEHHLVQQHDKELGAIPIKTKRDYPAIASMKQKYQRIRRLLQYFKRKYLLQYQEFKIAVKEYGIDLKD